jgi:hypothetical protein
MPRPPLGDRAMTDAERQRKRRERLRQERGPALTDRQKLIEAQQEIERLRQRIAALEADREEVHPARGRGPRRPQGGGRARPQDHCA